MLRFSQNKSLDKLNHTVFYYNETSFINYNKHSLVLRDVGIGEAGGGGQIYGSIQKKD